MHEYPYRDDVWVEDLGRADRRISITGFPVQDAAYGGGDVIAQRAAMVAACETPDDNDDELVRPSFGRMTDSLLDFGAMSPNLTGCSSCISVSSSPGNSNSQR